MIKVKNLSFGYEKSLILKEICFNLTKSCVCTILGPNGCGKTTLLKLLDKLLKPLKGSINVFEEDLNNLTLRDIAKRIAYLPQESNVSFSYTVFDVVLSGRAHNVGMFFQPKPEDKQKAIQSLKILGIEHLKNKTYAQLSGGQKRLVLIARALTQEAKVMLFDEPTNHLDFSNQFSILALIKKLTYAHNRTSILTLHDPNLAALFSDLVIMVKKGEILAFGKTSDVLTKENLSKLYERNINILRINDFIFALPEGLNV